MKKQGPCHHCGTNSTPMWRNGPAEKPILCNACGSRYRIRGTLANYTPKHSQAQQPIPQPKRFRIDECSPKQPNYKSIEYFYTSVPYFTASENDARASYKSTSSDSSMSSPRTSSSDDDEVKVLETEEHEENSGTQIGGEMENNSNKTSSEEYEDLSTVEKLQRDLYNIMKHERKSLQRNEETVLIYNANRLLVSPNEIGLGSALLKPPNAPAPKPRLFPPPHRRSRYRPR